MEQQLFNQHQSEAKQRESENYLESGLQVFWQELDTSFANALTKHSKDFNNNMAEIKQLAETLQEP